MCHSWYRSDVQNSPVVRDGESSHGNVVALGAKIEQRQQVSGEGGGQVQLTSRHQAQFVALHHQPSE